MIKSNKLSYIFTFILSVFCFSNTFAQTDTLSIIGVGDMMFGTNFPSKNYLPANDGKDLLAPVADILQAADVTFGNLEGVILDEGGTVKRCSDPSKCYAFRMPEKYVKNNLEIGGFDVVSIANNHVGDFGQVGRNNGVAKLKEWGVEAAGLVSVPSTTFTKNGIKYGFAAFAPNSGTMDVRNIDKAKQIVTELSKVSDVVIVSFHGGAEGRNHQHVTRKTEKFYGENRGNVYEFAHAMIDAGADIIFGHGPHVTRAVDIYKDRFITYSMGNFCTYARFSLTGASGYAPIFNVKTDKTGRFLRAEVTPIYQVKPGGVLIDKQKRVIKILQDLTKADFPELKINISDDGVITKED